jgi:zinc protease
MMKTEFKKLIEKNITQEELARAKQYLIGNFDIDLQRSSTISSLMLYDCLYGLDVKNSLSIAEKYESVTVEQIRKVSERIFSQNSMLSIVGPDNPFD